MKTREGRLTLFVLCLYRDERHVRCGGESRRPEGKGESWGRLLNNSCSLLRAAFAVGAFNLLGACGLEVRSGC